MSTRHLGFFLCKNCGTLCVFSLKSAKTYQNRDKNVKITHRSTVFKVFRRYFMPLHSVMPVLADFRSVLLFLFLCSVKKLEKLQPTGFEYFSLPFAPTKSHAADIERGFEPNNIRYNHNYVRYMTYRQKKSQFCSNPVP